MILMSYVASSIEYQGLAKNNTLLDFLDIRSQIKQKVD